MSVVNAAVVVDVVPWPLKTDVVVVVEVFVREPDSGVVVKVVTDV